MNTEFNLEALKKETVNNDRYGQRLAKLKEDGKEFDHIKRAVEESIRNIKEGQNSFVIYGEPQSGKTEMMIALTAKLLDEGLKIIIVLLNDNVQLLSQNLERFQRSGLSPAPKKFSEILSKDVKIGDRQWIIFSKKNARDLEKLINKLSAYDKKVVIDDEADYATPNSKINKKEWSKINILTKKLIGENGIYIGVTATPARLDLNRTHDNQNKSWIDFPPHSNYTGQEQFFPLSESDCPFILKLLPDQRDDSVCLREALFGFMVNAAYLNTKINKIEKNYSFLVHTSSKKDDHSDDCMEVVKSFEILNDDSSEEHKSFYRNMFDIASERYPEHAKEIICYILKNKDRNNIVVMNSDEENNAADNQTATIPISPFTIVVGGNIVSRGVTFENLLAMFFTRDVKYKMQQDTYIQRARMFGSRNDYLKYFELTIPRELYYNWRTCFILHRLSLASMRSNGSAPVWYENKKISATASTSVDKTQIVFDSGEMRFEIFDYSPVASAIKEIIQNTKITNLQKIKRLSELLGNDKLPKHLIDFIESFLPSEDSSIAIHEPKIPKSLSKGDAYTDQSDISRSKGFIGKFEREEDKYPQAIHHINIFFNNEGKARVFYIYQEGIRFLKTGTY